MTIRPAGPEDLENIADLYVRNHKSTYKGLLSDAYLDALTEEYALEKWERQLRAEDSEILVACRDGAFLGFAAFLPDPVLEGTWHLDSLHVKSRARGCGIGTALIRAGAETAERKGLRRMSVCIVRGNDHAGDLYRRLGAAHHAFFEDDFLGTVSPSEKLVWDRLPLDGGPSDTETTLTQTGKGGKER